jgi:4-hydroxymandelate oxidase
MCVEDAMAALSAGADVIGVSNHGGRVLDSGRGVADALPEIVKAVREDDYSEKVVITADGGVRTGFDVVKMLALGADFVLVGRPLAREAVSTGVEGVKRILEFLKTDMKIAMIMTSCNTLEDINEETLVKENQ